MSGDDVFRHPRLGVTEMAKGLTDSYVEHDLHGSCWCQPLVEHTLDGDLIIHRRTLDSPHIEDSPTHAVHGSSESAGTGSGSSLVPVRSDNGLAVTARGLLPSKRVDPALVLVLFLAATAGGMAIGGLIALLWFLA